MNSLSYGPAVASVGILTRVSIIASTWMFSSPRMLHPVELIANFNSGQCRLAGYAYGKSKDQVFKHGEMKRNILRALKIGTCLMVAVTCATMLITGNVDEEVVDFIS